VTFDPHSRKGFVVHSFAGDDPINCRDHVRALLGLPAYEALHPETKQGSPGVSRQVGDTQSRAEADRFTADTAAKTDLALAIWRQAGNPFGTAVEQYLRSRGLSIEGEAIRFHGALRFEGGIMAGMVALMRDVLTNEPTGVHRTFLDVQARKVGRKMLGRAQGACVKLSDDAEVTQGLGIAEGIETALSVMQAGFRPMWACLSAGAIAAFPVLPGVGCLTIFADRDESRTGERAAQECLARWTEAGREALAITPDCIGDWNDAQGSAA
jgi:hypothetical protein